MDAIDRLFDAAREARDKAWAPYSRFRVGAAVLTDTGRVFPGCNVENAAYPLGVCAEAAAIAAMVVAGERRITDIALIGEGPDPITPCGGCRQRLIEFMVPGARAHLLGAAGLRETILISQLLPRAFGPDDLASSAKEGKRQ